MRKRRPSAMLTVCGTALGLFTLSGVVGCSHSTTVTTSPLQTPSTTPTVVHTPSLPSVQTVDTSSFPVWAQNEYKAESYLGKSKTAMVSAMGTPVSVEGGPNDRYIRLAYIYPGDPGDPPTNFNGCQVQVYFRGSNDTPTTISVMNPKPTLGDVFDYLCGPGAKPTDVYCGSNPNLSSLAYVYGKTRQGHRFIVGFPFHGGDELVNYPKTFDVKSNQFVIGAPTFNVGTWRQAVPISLNVFENANDIKPGQPVSVGRYFSIDATGFRDMTHIKVD